MYITKLVTLFEEYRIARERRESYERSVNPFNIPDATRAFLGYDKYYAAHLEEIKNYEDAASKRLSEAFNQLVSQVVEYELKTRGIIQ